MLGAGFGLAGVGSVSFGVICATGGILFGSCIGVCFSAVTVVGGRDIGGVAAPCIGGAAPLAVGGFPIAAEFDMGGGPTSLVVGGFATSTGGFSAMISVGAFGGFSAVVGTDRDF